MATTYENSHIIKEFTDIYNSSSLERSRSPTRSQIAYRSAAQSLVNHSFGPRNDDKGDSSFNSQHGSLDDDVVDTSNARVSSMAGGASRRDYWEAIAKSKTLLSYGSLESLANLANSDCRLRTIASAARTSSRQQPQERADLFRQELVITRRDDELLGRAEIFKSR